MEKSIGEREIVLGLLMEITEQGVYSHIALKAVLEKYQYLDKKERAFITRVTEGTLEHMIELDYILDQFSSVKTKKMKPVIRNILRSAVYQLKYMDNVPDSAVCNEAVKLAVKKGFRNLKGFVNGVLRNTARSLAQVEYPKEPVKRLSVQYSMPEWIIRLWMKAYDLGTVERILEAFQEERPLTVRCNQSLCTPETLKAALEAEGVTVTPHPYLPYAFSLSGYDYLGNLKSFQDGLFAVQDVSSMLVTEAAAQDFGNCTSKKEQCGETGTCAVSDEYRHVIDVCAAPGGKSLHMAEKLGKKGQVEARDLTEHKVNLIEENIRRLGAENISASVRDALVLDEGSVEKADIVIADLPCSGLGVMGKKTDLKYKTTLEQTSELAALQKNILDVVCRYVKPGGALLYSTCTINPAENEENVRWFLMEHPEFAQESFEDLLCESLKKQVKNQCLQLLPGVNECDGFFIAKFRRGGKGTEEFV